MKLIEEIKSYWWGDQDLPIKKDDHCLDEMRYYIMSLNAPIKKKEEKSIILKEKEKLIKNLKYSQKKF